MATRKRGKSMSRAAKTRVKELQARKKRTGHIHLSREQKEVFEVLVQELKQHRESDIDPVMDELAVAFGVGDSGTLEQHLFDLDMLFRAQIKALESVTAHFAKNVKMSKRIVSMEAFDDFQNKLISLLVRSNDALTEVGTTEDFLESLLLEEEEEGY